MKALYFPRDVLALSRNCKQKTLFGIKNIQTVNCIHPVMQLQ